MKHYELFLYKLYRMSCRIILQKKDFKKRTKSILQKLYKNVLQNNSTNSHKFTPQNTYIEEAKKIKKNYSPNNKIKKENNKKGKNMYWKIIKI